MKTVALALTCFLLLAAGIVRANDPARQLLLAANSPTARQLTKAAIRQQADAFLNEGQFEAGYLLLLSGQRVPVTGLRYHIGQRVVEVQDSLQADSTSYYPLASLRGFGLGSSDDSLATRRHYRVRLVHQPHQPARPEAVQLLTGSEAGPLVLANLPVLLPGTRTPASILLAGPGREPAQPLLPLDARDTSLRRLLGRHAQQVADYARANNLYGCTPCNVARMLDYYNHLLVVATR